MLQQDIRKILQIQLSILIVKLYQAFLKRLYSYDILATGPSITLDYAYREPSTATSNTNCFNVWYGYNVPKCITRPTLSIIIVKIYNTSYAAPTLLVNTTNGGVE